MGKCHGIAEVLDGACFGVDSVIRSSENPPARKDFFFCEELDNGVHLMWMVPALHE